MEKKILFSEFPPVSTQEWEAKISEDLKGADYDKKLVWHTSDGFAVKPYYRSEDLADINLKNLPAQFPFRRSTKESNNWEIRQNVRFPEIEKAKAYLAKGAEAITLEGANIDDKESLAVVFDNIDPTKNPIHFTGVYSYPKLMRQIFAEVEKRGLNPNSVKGSFDFDYYSYFLFRREFYHSFEANRKELKNIFDKTASKLPAFKIINVNAKNYHNSGSTLVQELAFGLAHGAEYLTDTTDSGLKIEEVLPRMQFTFSIGSSYFMEIAKFRAARVLWSKIVKAFGVDDVELCKIHIHGITSEWNKTIFDPHVNILRTTTESMSAAIGGVDAMTVLPFDSVYRRTDEFSERVARNQQIMMKEEVNLDKVIDPAGGSYYIEKLTDSIVEATWNLFMKIQDMGGFRAALEEGFVFYEIAKSAAAKDMDIAQRTHNILGTNQFPNMLESMSDKVEFEFNQAKGGLRKYRGAMAFEEIRLKTERFVKAGGKKPVVFMLTFGNLNMRKARANFVLNFFGCAGFEVIDNAGFNTLAEGLAEADAKNADIVVLCSSDEEYLTFADGLNTNKPAADILVAGYPKDDVEKLRELGVSGFIHLKSNILEVLKVIQEKFKME